MKPLNSDVCLNFGEIWRTFGKYSGNTAYWVKVGSKGIRSTDACKASPVIIN